MISLQRRCLLSVFPSLLLFVFPTAPDFIIFKFAQWSMNLTSTASKVLINICPGILIVYLLNMEPNFSCKINIGWGFIHQDRGLFWFLQIIANILHKLPQKTGFFGTEDQGWLYFYQAVFHNHPSKIFNNAKQMFIRFQVFIWPNLMQSDKTQAPLIASWSCPSRACQ